MNDSTRNIIEHAGRCVAFAGGPAGELDGVLLFGPRGFISSDESDVLQFPLTTVPEGSELRAWLRISVYTGKPVPCELLFHGARTGEMLVARGAAHLVPPEAAEDIGRRPSPVVAFAVDTIDQLETVAAGALAANESPTTQATADDRVVRAMAENARKEITDPVQHFLARANDLYLYGINPSGAPALLQAYVGDGSASHGSRLHVLDAHTLYVARSQDGKLQTSPAVLMCPNYGAQIAVRAYGTVEALALSEAPPEISAAFEGATSVLRLSVTRIDAQAGSWFTGGEAPKGTGSIRVSESVLRIHGSRSVGRPEVAFVGGPTVLARDGQSLLELAEANGVPMDAGCRMGICGADPVQIAAGAENLTQIRRSEQSTLDRLGLPAGCRMACSARVHGSVVVAQVSDIPETVGTTQTSGGGSAGIVRDPAVQRVVVVGTGIAGITVVEEVRKADAEIEITVLGAERYDFYNRMAISRLVDEDVSPDKLSLMSTDWAQRRRVRYAPGVEVTSIDRNAHAVQTAEGPVEYDRLVLATGARSMIPPIEGIDIPGTFALRTIDDALDVRRHVSLRTSRRAVIVGGGLLGLEAAYHLAQTGLRVWIVGRAEWPANRQLDEQAGRMLAQMLQDLGIEYVSSCEPRRILGTDHVEGVELVDGRVLQAGTCLIAAGIVPDTTLARGADLQVVGGVVVDEHMRTSDPAIYAAGDVIEYRGRGFGLWPASVEQARIAAINLLGGEVAYNATMSPAQLKVPGVDVLSVGQVVVHEDEDREIRVVDQTTRGYRKLVHRKGKAIGAILIGSPELFDDVSDTVQAGRDLSAELAAIERGDWTVLATNSSAVDRMTPVAPHALV